ncbi:helix-turn-helix domain-containing protein [Candidatus Binatia bacterium]|nr:helix-turn-helix domain-containing protein [Candidatus Binatia bacterium]
MKLLEKIARGPLTLGMAIESIRKSEELSQDECARKLGVSKSHLCDVEKGRKTVSPERAAKWARALSYPESVLVRLAIQSELDAAGLKYKVEIEAAQRSDRSDRLGRPVPAGGPRPRRRGAGRPSPTLRWELPAAGAAGPRCCERRRRSR